MDPSTIEDIDVPLTAMSSDDLKQLKVLYNQSYEHYKKLLNDAALMTGLKEGDILAVKLCMAEVEKDIKEIDDLIDSKKLIKGETDK